MVSKSLIVLHWLWFIINFTIKLLTIRRDILVKICGAWHQQDFIPLSYVYLWFKFLFCFVLFIHETLNCFSISIGQSRFKFLNRQQVKSGKNDFYFIYVVIVVGMDVRSEHIFCIFGDCVLIISEQNTHCRHSIHVI